MTDGKRYLVSCQGKSSEKVQIVKKYIYLPSSHLVMIPKNMGGSSTQMNMNKKILESVNNIKIGINKGHKFVPCWGGNVFRDEQVTIYSNRYLSLILRRINNIMIWVYLTLCMLLCFARKKIKIK